MEFIAPRFIFEGRNTRTIVQGGGLVDVLCHAHYFSRWEAKIMAARLMLLLPGERMWVACGTFDVTRVA